jgi:hypothetical protein
MPNLRDLELLAARIDVVCAYRNRTAGWDSGDALEFRNLLPGSRAFKQLPSSETVRAMPTAQAAPHWRHWTAWILRCEGYIRDNRPGNPRRTMRDLRRGKVNSRTLPFLLNRGR